MATAAKRRSSPRGRTATQEAALPPQAVPAPLPATLQPQLATLVDAPPADGGDWFYEVKFDGYRLLARIEDGQVRLVTRNGNDWTARMPDLAAALAQAGWPDGWYDGEIAVPDENGIPDFQALQNAFDSTRTQRIVYYVFDVPFCNGYDLRGVPLSERRRLVEALFRHEVPAAIRLSGIISADAASVVRSACQMGLEGVIGKRKSSIYTARRSADWIKLKCSQRQEFIIGGYTDPQGARKAFGSLLLGVHDEHGALRYVGNVGTGFSERSLEELRHKLAAYVTEECPFANRRGILKRAHWVEPVLLAEVSFGSWTDNGHIRHSVFHGLRADKPPRAIVREAPAHARGPAAARGKAGSGGPSRPSRRRP
ncbi:hypothetical protein GCM10023144_02600 [Pigmentiphaga soli]|uniref:DNA ligase (ATP) n=1 Tax=Pigmentiphaga soli TaxID=1007095 RepID=A0ABP8GDV0_9BURK